MIFDKFLKRSLQIVHNQSPLDSILTMCLAKCVTKVEYRIKFYIIPEDNPSETLNKLTQAYNDHWFLGDTGRETAEDKPHSGRENVTF